MLACLATVFLAALPLAYEDLLPVPRQVDVFPGAVPAAALERTAVRRGPVAGAPDDVADQAYRLDLTPTGVVVTAGGPAGERYARVTLGQLAKLSGGRPIPCARVTDWPEVRWRGYMNDCGRNFLAVEGVKAVLETMGRYKMNLFHWHLADYHGWRLESRLHPRVTAPETMMRQVGRFYSQDDFREICAYAKARGITVMPELDVPGHSLALRKGLGVSSMDAPGVKEKVADLFRELCSLAPPDEMPFVHLGTDEVSVEPERVGKGWCAFVADAVADCGRTCVVWAPGQKFASKGELVDMVYWESHFTNSTRRCFDASRMYFASTGPQLLLNQFAFTGPCAGIADPRRRLGAIACTWHDDNVGEDTLRLFRNATVLPGIVGFASGFWSGARERPRYVKRLPPVGSDDFAYVRDLERRLLVHRDRLFADLPLAFPYLAQTDCRWRISWEDGRLIDGDYPGGLIDVSGFVTNAFGTVVAETWIKSPSNQTVGAWIGFTNISRDHGLVHASPLPGKGEWNRFGAKAELNGEEIAPPDWKRPGLVMGEPLEGAWNEIWVLRELEEEPFGDQEYYMREPTPITLKEGWNHVKLTVPYPGRVKGSKQRPRWVMTFIPVLGPTDHPREVPGLEYSCDPR